MESRLRRFITKRREKQTSRRPSLVSQSSSLPNDGTDDCLLQAVPYEAVLAGQAPIFSSQPVRGNGPVKLQTSHRLSTGELLPTTQDNKRTLEDILEGEYIVGGKGRTIAYGQPIRHVVSQPTPALSTSPSCSEYSGSPQTPPDTSTMSWLPSLGEHMDASRHQTSIAACGGLGISQNVDTSLRTQFGHYFNRESRSSYTSTCTAPSVQTMDDQSATIAALLKAEQNRLTDIYGRDRFDHRAPRAARENAQSGAALKCSSRDFDQTSEIVITPSPRPGLITGEDYTKRSSNTSAASSQDHSPNSDISSNERMSLTSSYAASSTHTAVSSVTDHDATATRDEIRKIVDEMRSTYIQALEARAPSALKPGHHGKKKRRPKPNSAVARTHMKHSVTALERQTWHINHSQDKQGSLKGAPGTRATSQPVAGLGRLSPVEASPPQTEKRPSTRLQRADSSTLGSITSRMADDDRKTRGSPTLGHSRESVAARNRMVSIMDDSTIGDGNISDIRSVSDHVQTISSQHNIAPADNFF